MPGDHVSSIKLLYVGEEGKGEGGKQAAHSCLWVVAVVLWAW